MTEHPATAGHPAISAHAETLTSVLPGDLADELSDGLHQTYLRHLALHGNPDAAACAAISEFGDPQTLARACVQGSPGWRAARGLLATGPLVGATWAFALITAHAWEWNLPAAAGAAIAVTLATAIAALATAALTARGYRPTRRLALTGAAGALLIDILLPLTVAMAAPTVTTPLTVAIAASLTRLAWTTTHVRALWATGRDPGWVQPAPH